MLNYWHSVIFWCLIKHYIAGLHSILSLHNLAPCAAVSRLLAILPSVLVLWNIQHFIGPCFCKFTSASLRMSLSPGSSMHATTVCYRAVSDWYTVPWWVGTVRRGLGMWALHPYQSLVYEMQWSTHYPSVHFCALQLNLFCGWLKQRYLKALVPFQL